MLASATASVALRRWRSGTTPELTLVSTMWWNSKPFTPCIVATRTRFLPAIVRTRAQHKELDFAFHRLCGWAWWFASRLPQRLRR